MNGEWRIDILKWRMGLSCLAMVVLEKYNIVYVMQSAFAKSKTILFIPFFLGPFTFPQTFSHDVIN